MLWCSSLGLNCCWGCDPNLQWCGPISVAPGLLCSGVPIWGFSDPASGPLGPRSSGARGFRCSNPVSGRCFGRLCSGAPGFWCSRSRVEASGAAVRPPVLWASSALGASSAPSVWASIAPGLQCSSCAPFRDSAPVSGAPELQASSSFLRRVLWSDGEGRRWQAGRWPGQVLPRQRVGCVWHFVRTFLNVVRNVVRNFAGNFLNGGRNFVRNFVRILSGILFW